MRRLTPELECFILAQIRAGSYPHVAAEAVGVPRHVFRAWLKRGRERGRGRCWRLLLHVRQAQSQARARAEMEALKKDPKFWLRYGPGKEAVDAPRWGPPPKGSLKRRSTSQLPPQVLQLLGRLAGQLEPFPAARQALLHLLDAASAP